jgi:hypothetical protein
MDVVPLGVRDASEAERVIADFTAKRGGQQRTLRLL